MTARPVRLAASRRDASARRGFQRAAHGRARGLTRSSEVADRPWWLAALVALVLLSLGGVDHLLRAQPALPMPVIGALDEPAHLGTAALILAALPRPSRLGIASCLVATVAIDSDHLPGLLGWWHGLVLPGERPVTHALWVPLLLLALATVLPARAQLALRWGALGVAIHLLRDAATGGIALFWPITPAPLRVPHGGYLLVIAACGLVAVGRRWRPRRMP